MSENNLIEQLVAKVAKLGSQEAVKLLKKQDSETAAQVMTQLNPVVVEPILHHLPADFREKIFEQVPAETAKQWRANITYPVGTIGSLMEQPKAVFPPETTVAQTIDKLRELVKRAFITYVYVIDAQGKLVGLVVMRELLLAKPEQTLADVMIREPFSIKPTMPQLEAMRTVLTRHFPVYPVTDEAGKLVGLLRGSTLFEKQAVELTAQAGSMVGVEKEERVATPWVRSLRFRQPWLQLNLVTAFVAAAVVGMFEGTIDRIVVLAAFLPVLAGQSGNTGCQAMAISLRAMTLGDLAQGAGRKVMLKEAWLGFLNGLLTGITAAGGMYFYCMYQGNDAAFKLAVVVCVAMVISCIISGVFGVVVPLTLKKFGFDPAAASSIFLTTATDVVSMGCLLGLATLFV